MTFGKDRKTTSLAFANETENRTREVKEAKVKKTLFSLMAILLAVGLVGGGAFAYFSDVETSTGNTFTAGTLDMQIKDVDDPWGDGVTATWVSPDWKPGEEVNATLQVKNVGSVDAYFFYVNATNLSEGEGLTPESETGAVCDIASQIYVTWFELKVNGWTVGNWAPWIANWGPFQADGAGEPLTLRELVDDIYGPMLVGSGVLAANEGNEIQVIMTLQFNPNASNDYQGDQCSFDLVAIAGSGPPTYFWKAGEGSLAYGYGSRE